MRAVHSVEWFIRKVYQRTQLVYRNTGNVYAVELLMQLISIFSYIFFFFLFLHRDHTGALKYKLPLRSCNTMPQETVRIDIENPKLLSIFRCIFLHKIPIRFCFWCGSFVDVFWMYVSARSATSLCVWCVNFFCLICKKKDFFSWRPCLKVTCFLVSGFFLLRLLFTIIESGF